MISRGMTRAEMIRWLGDAISTETEKPFEEIDCDYVDRCGYLLDELMSKSAAMSEEEIADRIAKLKSGRTSAVRKKVGHRNFWKVAVAAAIVLCTSITVVAVPAWRQAILTTLQLDVGESVIEDGITYIHTGEIKIYSNMDELIASENLDILSYKDPDGILKITTVDYMQDISKTTITFNDSTINFLIEHDVYTITDAIKSSSEELTTPYFNAYLVNKPGNNTIGYISYFIYDDNTYNINCSDKDTLISILNSLHPGD